MPENVLPYTEKLGRLPRKNAYFEPHVVGPRNAKRASVGKTKHAKKFIARLASILERSGFVLSADHPEQRPICFGWWSITVLACVKRWNRSLDVLTPAADSDCCLSPVKDALQHAGLLDNDGRICTDRSFAVHGPEDALFVRLVRTDPDDELLAALGDRGASYFDFRSFAATSFFA